METTSEPLPDDGPKPISEHVRRYLDRLATPSGSERSFRRGYHHGAVEAYRIAVNSGSLEEAIRQLGDLEDRAQQQRNEF